MSSVFLSLSHTHTTQHNTTQHNAHNTTQRAPLTGWFSQADTVGGWCVYVRRLRALPRHPTAFVRLQRPPPPTPPRPPPPTPKVLPLDVSCVVAFAPDLHTLYLYIHTYFSFCMLLCCCCVVFLSSDMSVRRPLFSLSPSPSLSLSHLFLCVTFRIGSLEKIVSTPQCGTANESRTLASRNIHEREREIRRRGGMRGEKGRRGREPETSRQKAEAELNGTATPPIQCK